MRSCWKTFWKFRSTTHEEEFDQSFIALLRRQSGPATQGHDRRKVKCANCKDFWQRCSCRAVFEEIFNFKLVNGAHWGFCEPESRYSRREEEVQYYIFVEGANPIHAVVFPVLEQLGMQGASQVTGTFFEKILYFKRDASSRTYLFMIPWLRTIHYAWGSWKISLGNSIQCCWLKQVPFQDTTTLTTSEAFLSLGSN